MYKKTLAADSFNYVYIKKCALAGICLLFILSPFFRGLFFAPDQQRFFVYTVLVFWLACLWKFCKGESKFLSHPMDYLAFAFPVVYLIAAPNAANWGYAVNEIVKSLMYFMVYWVVANLVSDEEDAIKIIKALCIGGVMVAIAGLGAATGVVSTARGFDEGRIFSVFQYPNALAIYMVSVLFLSLYLWLRAVLLPESKTVKGSFSILSVNAGRYIYLLTSFIIVFAFAGAKSYGGYLVLALVLAACLIVMPRIYRVSAAFHLLSAGGVALLGSHFFIQYALDGKPFQAWAVFMAGITSLILIQSLYFHMEKRGLPSIKRGKFLLVLIIMALLAGFWSILFFENQPSDLLTTAQLKNKSAMNRIYSDLDALKMMAERPLLGWGGGGWTEAYKKFQGYSYYSNQVHGYYFQVAVEAGAAGLLVIFSIWLLFFYTAYQGIKSGEDPGKKLLLWTVFFSATALGIHALIDIDLSLSAISMVLWATWALLRGLNNSAAIHKKPVKKEKANKKPYLATILVSMFCLALVFADGCLIAAGHYAGNSSDLQEKGDLAGAVSLMKKAVQLNPFEPEYNDALSRLYMQQGLGEPAIKEAREALKKGKFNPLRHDWLAVLYIKMNKPEEAVDMAQKAVEMDPFNIKRYEQLSFICARAGYELMVRGKKNEARTILTIGSRVNNSTYLQVAKMSPQQVKLWWGPWLAPTPQTNLYCGASFYMLGDFEKAKLCLQEVSGNERLISEASQWLKLISLNEGKPENIDKLLMQATEAGKK